MPNKKFKEPSMTIAEDENMPNLTVPNVSQKPTAPTPPQQNESEEQYNRKIDHFRYDCSPDGYPTVINDAETVTEDVANNPYWTNQITKRSGVVGAGDLWFHIAEGNASWRQQHALPDKRYTGAYPVVGSDDVEAYYNAKPPKRKPNLRKHGPYAQFINGVSYVPKSIIMRDMPAIKLFSMQGDDVREPSMQDLRNDRKDPYYMTIANNLGGSRSYSHRTKMANDIVRSRKVFNKILQSRLNKVVYPYGEGIGAESWTLNQMKRQNAPHDLPAHRKHVMMSGIIPHALKSNSQAVLGNIPSAHSH
jgi:hypothetical protein